MKRITGAFIEDFGQMVSTLNELIDAFNSHQKEHDRTTKERCDFFDDVFDRISKLENKLAGHEEIVYDGIGCPLCDANQKIGDLKVELDEANDKIEEMEEK